MAAIVYGTSSGPKRHVLGPRTDLGRSPECDVVLVDATISRRHASIVRNEAGHVLRDLQSRFGTTVNGRTITEHTLRDGDEIHCGSVALTFQEHLLPELEQALSTVSHLERKANTLVSLLDAVMRDFRPGFLLQAAGPTLLTAFRAERGAILASQPPRGELTVAFSHRFDEAEARESALVADALMSGESRERRLPDGALEVACPLRGSDSVPHGAALLRLPAGREFGREDRELLASMCGQIGSALSALELGERFRREERIRRDLSRYVSDQVADAIVAGRLALNLGGESRRVTVVFVDVRGFTALAERLHPQEVIEILNDHFGDACAVVKGALGTVDKYIGDALMAVFGAPNHVPDQAVRAVKAAIEIRRAVASRRARWASRPWAARSDPANFAIGIGVNTGNAVAGNLGSDERKEYTVIGDAVNVASRLCAAAGPSQILIGPETARELHGLVDMKSLGPRPVKGRAEPVETWEVREG